MRHQKGDRRILTYTYILAFLLVIFLLNLTYLFFVDILYLSYYFEDPEIGTKLLWNILTIILILSAWFFIRRNYNKIDFKETHILLKSPIKIFDRKIRYSQILSINIDNYSNRRTIETKKEYFLVDILKKVDIEKIAKEKGIKVISN